MTAKKKSKDCYTMGDVARICRVSARTAMKWFDEGILVGFRIPLGSRDRRVPKENLAEFMAANGMPQAWLETYEL